MSKKMIECLACHGRGWFVTSIGSINECAKCGTSGRIPDRRRLTASDRAVERIKEWCAKMIMEDCACCQTAGYEVSTIIREEAERG